MTTQLLDTTFRPVLFGIDRKVSIANGRLKTPVAADKLNAYVSYLETMACFSRLIYCDSGVLHQLLPSVGKVPNKTMNKQITDADAAAPRRAPSALPNSKEGRPMMSYVTPVSQSSGPSIGTYIASASDLTCMILPGPPLPGALPTDVLVVFKGSSTIKNFKHDLMTVAARDTLQNLVNQVGIRMDPSVEAINVPSPFVLPLLKSWDLLMRVLRQSIQTNARVFITGHSLGGAFATMFGFILAEARLPFLSSIHITTFGAPTLMGDGGRNRFNEHLDQGYMTLDRVVSTAGPTSDPIPSIPPKYSHPGFRPLNTEWNADKTGRVVTLDGIKRVYQAGGAFGIAALTNVRKQKYEQDTMTHIPNVILIPSDVPYFPHAGYFGMTFLGAFRLFGMKNPGFKGKDGSWNTLVVQFYDDGVKFQYVKGSPEPIAAEAEAGEAGLQSVSVQGGQRRKTQRRRHRTARRYV